LSSSVSATCCSVQPTCKTPQQWEPAEKSLQAAIRSDPNYCAAAYIILARVYNTEGRYDEAQAAAERATSAGVDSWSVQYEIARVLIGKGEYENALAIADTVLRSKHGSLLHVAKAHALLGLRRYPESATELRNYLRYEPGGEGGAGRARHPRPDSELRTSLRGEHTSRPTVSIVPDYSRCDGHALELLAALLRIA